MKAHDHPMAKAERAILEALGSGTTFTVPGDVHEERLLLELEHKEKVIRAVDGGYERTDRGTNMLKGWS